MENERERIMLIPVTIHEFEEMIYRQVKRVLNDQPSDHVESKPDDLMSLQEAAGMLSVAIPTMYGYIYRKEIPYMKRRGRLFFSKAELMEWLKSSRKPTKDEIKQMAKESLK